MVLVKNKPNTSNENPPEGFSSWIDFWNCKKGREATCCRCCSHNKKSDLKGCHVIDENENTYITPLCSECNFYTNTDYFFVNENDLVKI